MKDLLTYDFHKYLGYLIILGAPLPFLKINILKDFSVIEQLIYSNFMLFIIFLMIYFLYQKKELKSLLQKSRSNKMNQFSLFIGLVFITLIISGTILQKEGSVIKFKSYQRSLSMVLLVIIGMCLFKEKITFNMFLGIFTIILGLYLIEKK